MCVWVRVCGCVFVWVCVCVGVRVTRRVLFNPTHPASPPLDRPHSRPTEDLDPKKGTMRMGPYMTSSSTIGTGAWETPYSQPKFGTVSPTKNFYDKSHLQVTGF